MLVERKAVYRRTLSRAAEVAGGYPRLAIHLGVSPAQLVRWVDGEEMPPVRAFLGCMRLLDGGAAARP